MKFLKAIAVFCCILLLSALLAPLIYQFTSYKFERILSRLVMVFSLIAIFLFVRIRTLDFRKYGLTHDKAAPARLLHGFAVGFLTLLLLTVILVAAGARDFSSKVGGQEFKFCVKLFEYALSALVIGFTEEFFFRGFLIGQFRSRYPLPGSFLAANLIYAVLHFFRGDSYSVPARPAFADSLQVMIHLADPFLDLKALWPGFLGLFLFGMVLSYTYWKTGSLYLSIGIHAGAVFLLKVDNWFVTSNPAASVLIYGDKNLHSGVLGWLFLGALFLYLRACLSKNSVSH